MQGRKSLLCFISEKEECVDLHVGCSNCRCHWTYEFLQTSTFLSMLPTFTQLKIKTQIKGGHIFLMWNLHIPHTYLPELSRNMSIKSILMKDCENKPVLFQSTIFKTSLPGTHEVLAYISKITYLLLKHSCSPISNKWCDFNFDVGLKWSRVWNLDQENAALLGRSVNLQTYMRGNKRSLTDGEEMFRELQTSTSGAFSWD